MRPQSAPRSMRRRANSAISSAPPRRRPGTARRSGCRRDRFGDAVDAVGVGARTCRLRHPLALLTSMSTGPSSASASSNRRGMAVGSARSASTATARPPPARIESTTADPSVALLERVDIRVLCGVDQRRPQVGDDHTAPARRAAAPSPRRCHGWRRSRGRDAAGEVTGAAGYHESRTGTHGLALTDR